MDEDVFASNVLPSSAIAGDDEVKQVNDSNKNVNVYGRRFIEILPVSSSVNQCVGLYTIDCRKIQFVI